MRDPFLEGMSQGWQVIDASRLVADRELEADVAIVGSGAGGGIAAEILAKAGLKVAIIEEGPLKTSTDFKLREADAYPQLYQESAARKTKDKAINILQGRCVGGSTTVKSRASPWIARATMMPDMQAASVATISRVLKRRESSSKTKAMPPKGVLNATPRLAPAAALCMMRTTSSGSERTWATRAPMVAPTWTDGLQVPLSVDPAGNLRVNSTGGGAADGTAFTAGSTTFSATGGVFNENLAAITSGKEYAARITPQRALHQNLRNGYGIEVGTAQNPLMVALAPSQLATQAGRSPLVPQSSRLLGAFNRPIGSNGDRLKVDPTPNPDACTSPEAPPRRASICS